jgi:hypothetical protein
MAEQWRPVVGFEGVFEVSDHGNVRSLGWIGKRGRVHPPGPLNQSIDPRGYRRVSLQGSPYLVAPLVLSAFVGPRPPGLDGCHGDGDNANNRLGNLRWGTRSENMQDAVDHGTHTSHGKRTALATCKKGHDITDPANLYLRDLEVYGRRTCIICKDAHNAEKNAARRAATAARRKISE